MCEVSFDHLQGNRFRHAATFQRRRTDKRHQDCDFEQLEAAVPYELHKIFDRG